MSARTMLNDTLWQKIEYALRKAKCRMVKGTRETVEGILWHLRTGSPWRDLPPEFGKWNTVYTRFNSWASEGKLF
jgi:transposase